MLSDKLSKSAQWLVEDYLAGNARIVHANAFRVDRSKTQNFNLSFIITSERSDYFLRVLVIVDPCKIIESETIRGVFMDFVSYEDSMSSGDLITLIPDGEQRMALCWKIRKEVFRLGHGELRKKVYDCVDDNLSTLE